MIAPLLAQTIGHSLVQTLGWTLVHFTWQAFLIAILVATALRFVNHSHRQSRYLVTCLGLMLSALVPIATFVYLFSTQDLLAGNTSAWYMTDQGDVNETIARHSLTAGDGMTTFDSQSQEGMADESASLSAGFWIDSLRPLLQTLQPWMPWCVVVWGCGVLLLTLRLLAGIWRIQRWRTQAVPIKEAGLNRVFTELSKRMGIRSPIRLLQSASVMVPAVVGWIRPAVLVPASMVTGLTTSEFELIMAHELAHIRRHDYLINLLQTVVETLLFYHPAIWWLSHQIRVEREYCCDNMAATVCGNRQALAQALAKIETLRCHPTGLAMAADGGSLLSRIRWLLVDGEVKRSSNSWLSGVLVLGSLTLLITSLWVSQILANPASSAPDRPSVSDDVGLLFRIVADANYDPLPCNRARLQAYTGDFSTDVYSAPADGQPPKLLATWVRLARKDLQNPTEEGPAPFKFLPSVSHLVRNAKTGELIDIGRVPLPKISGDKEHTAFRDWCESQNIDDVEILLLHPETEQNGRHEGRYPKS